ncbi:hypothetical protein [Streptomyces sp. JJ38]|uniref:hypothetical protein n=1 Tax=Streptomyces sp. JJ38 TaxID=2738128 RepID=UPI00214CD99A|nr:hypothetical protein [Streptomyces sp. JJ38]
MAVRTGRVRRRRGDGADFLCELLADGSAEACTRFAEDYSEQQVDRRAVASILTAATP